MHTQITGSVYSIYLVSWAHESGRPNSISIGSAIFVGLINMTARDRHTDIPLKPRYSV